MKIEYVVDIQTIIYSKNGEEIYGNTVLQKIPLGIVDKRKKNSTGNSEDNYSGYF